MIPVFKNVEGRYTAKNYRPVSLLSVVSKVFEKFVNDRINKCVNDFIIFRDSNIFKFSTEEHFFMHYSITKPVELS